MLEVHDISKRWPDFRLAVDLSLGDAKIGVVLGPSGCGKSTLLRIIAGLDAADSGSLSLNGRLLDGLPPEKRGLGMVFQDLALFPHLSVRRNIDYGLRMKRLARRHREDTVLELARSFGIERLLERRPTSLSGGERQRTALARTLAPGPELVLLDEPLSALDLELRRRLRGEIATRLREAGVMALHVTHDVDEAFAIADLLYLMSGGRIVERGSPEELYEHPRSAFAARFLGSGPLLPVERTEEGPALVKAKTPLGSFHCLRPRSGERDPAHATAREAAPVEALFFPAGAAEILSGEMTASPAAPNVFHARVVESSFAGRFRRVSLEGIPPDPREPPPRIELEFDAGRHIEPGTTLTLRVAAQRCLLLPETIAADEEECDAATETAARL